MFFAVRALVRLSFQIYRDHATYCVAALDERNRELDWSDRCG